MQQLNTVGDDKPATTTQTVTAPEGKQPLKHMLAFLCHSIYKGAK